MRFLLPTRLILAFIFISGVDTNKLALASQHTVATTNSVSTALKTTVTTVQSKQSCSSNALKVSTLEGWCLEVQLRQLKFPRGVLAHPDGSIWIALMNGWQSNSGQVVRWDPSKPQTAPTIWAVGLDRPHALRLGPDKRIYVGTVGAIGKLPLQAGYPLEWIIGGDSGVAGPSGKGMHPLTNFVFDHQNNLVVNSGAQTNNCELSKAGLSTAKVICPEEQSNPPSAALLHYKMRWQSSDNKPSTGRAQAPTVLATGLRNSMALAAHSSGTLLQAENARDAIHLADASLKDEQLPHDELNVIKLGNHYGWPYCFDANRVSPEYVGSSAAQCKNRSAPLLLLPPHAASLGMTYDVDGKLPAPLTGQLLVAMHGYRKGGHRIRVYKVDAQGIPLKPSNTNQFDLISGWEKPQTPTTGAPVEISIAQDGTLWITDDRNGQLLQLKKR
jgi:glucose/arabinose dehydrogenase